MRKPELIVKSDSSFRKKTVGVMRNRGWRRQSVTNLCRDFLPINHGKNSPSGSILPRTAFATPAIKVHTNKRSPNWVVDHSWVYKTEPNKKGNALSQFSVDQDVGMLTDYTRGIHCCHDSVIKIIPLSLVFGESGVVTRTNTTMMVNDRWQIVWWAMKIET